MFVNMCILDMNVYIKIAVSFLFILLTAINFIKFFLTFKITFFLLVLTIPLSPKTATPLLNFLSMSAQIPFSQDETLTMVDPDEAYNFVVATSLTQFQPILKKSSSKFKQLGIFGKKYIPPPTKPVKVTSYSKMHGTSKVKEHRRLYPQGKSKGKNYRSKSKTYEMSVAIEVPVCKESLSAAISLHLASVREFMNTSFATK